MPSGYNNPPDWRGFTGAVADAMFEQQREAVRRDHPKPPTYDELRAELEDLKRQRQLWMDQATENERLRAENEQLKTELAPIRLRLDQVERTNEWLAQSLSDNPVATPSAP